MARERHELLPPLRIHRFRVHLVVYAVGTDDDVLIVRVATHMKTGPTSRSRASTSPFCPAASLRFHPISPQILPQLFRAGEVHSLPARRFRAFDIGERIVDE